MSFWDSIKDTAKSLGGAVAAPYGAVVDLAQMPFDDKADNFGTVVHALASRTGDLVDPVLNPQTFTGGGISHALQAMNWAYQNVVSEPLATGKIAFNHSFHQGDFTMALLTGDAYHLENYKKFFDADTWSKAYETAQHESFGQAVAFGAISSGDDPFNYKDPYEDATAKQHPLLAGLTSMGTDVATAWYLDPTVIAGKAGGAALQYGKYGKLNAAQRGNLLAQITDSSKSGMLQRSLASRTDKYLNWIGGQNKIGRPLSGPEILAGTPELRQYATEPHVIAGLLADANKIEDQTQRMNAQRRILAVAAGDFSQITRLKQESAETAALADQLNNLQRGATINLLDLGKIPTLRTDPVFMRSLESQLDNLNAPGDIDKFVDHWNGRFNQLLGTEGNMTYLPGKHLAGDRATLRLNEKGPLRTPQRKLDDWSAKHLEQAQSASTVFQKGLHTVPLVVTKTVGMAASPYTKLPDALRQTNFVGVVHLHDWGGATNQLDSMMRLAKVTPADRMKLLSEAFLASDESSKMRAIQKIETASAKSLVATAVRRSGHEVDEGYLEALMGEGFAKRMSSTAALKGRAYAATQSPDVLRGGNIGKAEDMAAMQSKGLSAKPQGAWRVDQINDDGTPLALPLLETQLTNMVPLMDVPTLARAVKRDTSYMSRLSKAWLDDSRELQRLAGLKKAGHVGLDKAIAARRASQDWLINAGQHAMRVWKMSVLFRLGYPLRVLTDDHMRIWSKIGAGALYGHNLREFASNAKFNTVDRKRLAKSALDDLKIQRQQILDELDGERMTAHLARQDDLKKIQSSMRGHQRSIAGLRKQVQDAETKHSLGIEVPDLAALREKLKKAEGDLADKEAAQSFLLDQLGDYGPDQLKQRLSEIEGLIDAGGKGQVAAKRTIGTKGVDLGDGLAAPGAFDGEMGALWRDISSADGLMSRLVQAGEDRQYRAMSGGAHTVLQPDEAGHLYAWADVLNHQIRNSPVAMHFLKGGDVDGFVKWVRSPEQADLRRRLAHFAHDPEEWGHRVKAMVFDYVPTDALREAVVNGRVKPAQLERMFEKTDRPAVHGRVVADNLGESHAVKSIGRGISRFFTFLSEAPTDTLTRHPYFNTMYKSHVRDLYAVRKAGGQTRFTQADIEDMALQARKRALRDLKTTLFDLSAHSHAAHVMRFISPFLAAHQEGVSRWWRIAADNPAIVRHFTQAMDIPRYLQLEVDENGDLVKPGAPISSTHKILLQVPKVLGGKDARVYQSKWSVNESAGNIILQGGLTNPGMGPLVSVPFDYLATRYADDPSIARVARVFNPYPPQSPLEDVVPAVLKRAFAASYGATGIDPSLGLGIGKREYNSAYSQNLQDKMVDFQLKHDREPTSNEAEKMVEQAGHETTIQMFHRVLWNGLSPAPASPRSKYAVIQQGWYKISEQARAEGKDFDWAYAQFKAKYGEAYMPLVYSTSNNPAWVDASPAAVSALKHYKGVLNKVDPALTRMVIGAYSDDLVKQDKTLGEYSPDASNYLRTTTIKPGSDETYYSYDNPATALDEQMARRGWVKYGELTAGLTAQATAAGLKSYEDSPVLVALKQAGVKQLMEENYAWAKDYSTVDSNQYDRYLSDMRDIVSSPVLKNDPERTDIQTLGAYLQLRDFFMQAFDARKAQGLGGPEAAANDDLRTAYTALVHGLVESNTYFEEHDYNGIIDRDPLLLRTAS